VCPLIAGRGARRVDVRLVVAELQTLRKRVGPGPADSLVTGVSVEPPSAVAVVTDDESGNDSVSDVTLPDTGAPPEVSRSAPPASQYPLLLTTYRLMVCGPLPDSSPANGVRSIRYEGMSSVWMPVSGRQISGLTPPV
jgi:hypothetical protein